MVDDTAILEFEFESGNSIKTSAMGIIQIYIMLTDFKIYVGYALCGMYIQIKHITQRKDNKQNHI